MIALLYWLPAGTSLILGVPYLLLGEGRSALKIFGAIVFIAAVYLQFFSRHSLAGLLLQICLALTLALWRKMSSAA